MKCGVGNVLGKKVPRQWMLFCVSWSAFPTKENRCRFLGGNKKGGGKREKRNLSYKLLEGRERGNPRLLFEGGKTVGKDYTIKRKEMCFFPSVWGRAKGWKGLKFQASQPPGKKKKKSDLKCRLLYFIRGKE